MDLSEQLRDINTHLTAIIRKIGAGYAITFSQTNILLAIPVEGMFTSQLASRVGIEVSTATRNLSKLESKGFIRRKRDGYDRRKVIIILTEKGETLVENIDLKLDETAFELMQLIPFEDRENLIPILESFSWNLNRYRAQTGANH